MARPNLTEEELRKMLNRGGAKEAGVAGRNKTTGNGKRGVPYGASAAPASTTPPLRPSPYRSKWEAAYANKLQLSLLAGEISGWWYEPFSLWLPGKVRYKPDFLVQYPSGELYLLEVKGWSKNRRDGMTRLKIAASLFYCFQWFLVSRIKGGGWAHEEVHP